MYASKNFPTKAAFRKAVEAGERITLFAAGLGTPKTDGVETVSGPWSPKPHSWYANATMANGVVVKVK